MPRTAVPRPAAEPVSATQHERRRRILRSASQLATRYGANGVQMQTVAKDAGVALGTLYRYFPSKTHLFSAILADQVGRLDTETRRPQPSENPVDALHSMLVIASRRLLERPLLTTAMLHASLAANPETVTEASVADQTFRHLILRTLGIDHPSDADLVVVRLLLLCWHGLLTLALSGQLSMAQLEDHLHVTCDLLVPGFTAT